MNYNNRLSYDSLEPRLMLDGTLTVNLVNEILNIHGTGLDEAFEVIQFEAEQFFVIGKDTDGGLPTTINGLPQQFFGGVKGFNVSLGNGNDSGFFNGDPGQGATQEIVIEKDLVFAGGNGSDNFLTDGIKVQGNVIFNGGDGPDFAQIIDSTVYKEVRLNGRAGGDLLATFRSEFYKKVTINGGSGNDQILNGSTTNALEGSTFHDDLRIDHGDNHNTVELSESSVHGDISVRGSSIGTGDVTINKVTAGGTLELRGDVGDDIWNLTEVILSGNTLLQSGGGDDFLDIEECEAIFVFSHTFISAGDGNDTINVHNSNLGGDLIRIDGGSGNDKIKVDNSRLTSENARLDAGDGDDKLDFGQSNIDVIDLRINAGDGNDRLHFEDSELAYLQSRLNFSGGDDIVKIDNSTIRSDRTIVTTGDGDDRLFLVNSIVNAFSDIRLDGGAGNNIVNIDNTRIKSDKTVVIAKGGDDLIRFINAELDLHKILFINTGAGDDIIRFDQTRTLQNAGEIRVRTGEGDDEARIIDSILVTLEEFLIDMEEDDDCLLFDDTLLGPSDGRSFLGGPGDDFALRPAQGQYFFDGFETF